MIIWALLLSSQAITSPTITEPDPITAARRAQDAATALYFICIRDTARNFARGDERAEAIATAVTAACVSWEYPIKRAAIDYYAANRVGGGLAEEMWQRQHEPHLREKGRSDAMLWVIEARLPKTPQKK